MSHTHASFFNTRVEVRAARFTRRPPLCPRVRVRGARWVIRARRSSSCSSTSRVTPRGAKPRRRRRRHPRLQTGPDVRITRVMLMHQPPGISLVRPAGERTAGRRRLPPTRWGGAAHLRPVVRRTPRRRSARPSIGSRSKARRTTGVATRDPKRCSTAARAAGAAG